VVITTIVLPKPGQMVALTIVSKLKELKKMYTSKIMYFMQQKKKFLTEQNDLVRFMKLGLWL